jgi:hypothetical protein
MGVILRFVSSNFRHIALKEPAGSVKALPGFWRAVRRRAAFILSNDRYRRRSTIAHRMQVLFKQKDPTMIESFERCETARSYVLLDQTHEQCAEENECNPQHCPLKRFFNGDDPAAETCTV